jgi:hypothetical protein
VINNGYKITSLDVGFEVLTAVAMKSSVLWDLTPSSPEQWYSTWGTRRHLGVRKIKIYI